ncbi:MAG: hypothetical protein LC687_00715 [Actinobacteria bacterium]|nr:hypothetical protein [Actinomycetota bacterium]
MENNKQEVLISLNMKADLTELPNVILDGLMYGVTGIDSNDKEIFAHVKNFILDLDREVGDADFSEDLLVALAKSLSHSMGSEDEVAHLMDSVANALMVDVEPTN